MTTPPPDPERRERAAKELNALVERTLIRIVHVKNGDLIWPKEATQLIWNWHEDVAAQEAQRATEAERAWWLRQFEDDTPCATAGVTCEHEHWSQCVLAMAALRRHPTPASEQE